MKEARVEILENFAFRYCCEWPDSYDFPGKHLYKR